MLDSDGYELPIRFCFFLSFLSFTILHFAILRSFTFALE